MITLVAIHNILKYMKQSNILVVDDSNTNIVLLEAILADRGYKIDTALNVKDALHCIEKQKPDLILLDLLMPKISGFEFLEQLREDDKTKDTPVIVISALSDEENKNRTFRLGAVDYIIKPVDIQYLVDRVAKTLQ
jgi:PleD family two-component response regulator